MGSPKTRFIAVGVGAIFLFGLYVQHYQSRHVDLTVVSAFQSRYADGTSVPLPPELGTSITFRYHPSRWLAFDPGAYGVTNNAEGGIGGVGLPAFEEDIAHKRFLLQYTIQNGTE